MIKRYLPIWITSAIFLSNIILASTQAAADNSPKSNADADLAETQHQEAQMRLNFEKLNKSNPLYKPTETGTAPPSHTESGPILKPGQTMNANGEITTDTDTNTNQALKADAPIEKLGEVMNNPAIQGYLKLFTNPMLLTQAQIIAKHPNRQTILIVELVFFIILLIARAWVTAKIPHWFVRFIASIFITLGSIGICSFAIPWIFIGDPYTKLLTILYQGIMGQS